MLSIVKATYTKKDFPRVFKGLGKLKNFYEIHLDETDRQFLIATPRQLPLPMKQTVQEELKRLETKHYQSSENAYWLLPLLHF